MNRRRLAKLLARVRGQVRHRHASAVLRLAAEPGPAVARALEAAGEDAGEWTRRIEGLRTEMERSTDVLEAWTQPWLARSAELARRFGTEPAAQMTVAEAVRASKPEPWCRFLFHLTRELRPARVVELGTNVGVSGLYLAAAMEEVGGGRLVTLEGSPSKAGLAEDNLRRLGLAHRARVVVGDFSDTLEDALAEPVDLAFIDGFHDGAATLAFHRRFKEAASPAAVFVYDDVRWSSGMRSAWNRIRRDADVDIVIDLASVGVCVLTVGGGERLDLAAHVAA